MTKFLNPVMATLIAVALFSCNGGGKGTEEKMPDSSAATTVAPAPPPVFTPFNLLIIRHKVADFTKWEAGYMAHDSMRMASGLKHLHIGRGMEDSNTVVVFDSIADVQKAKAFGSSADLKEVMKKAGVVGPPTVGMVNVIRTEAPPKDMNGRLMIVHKVKDFAAWVKAYNAEGTATRQANGMVDRLLARGIDDSNMVYIIFVVTDMAKAKARATSPDLKKIMMDAGVMGTPDIFWYKLVD